MALKTKRWDSAKHLKSERDIAEYLDACIAEGADDPAFMTHALGVVARARNLSQLARDTGFTREGLRRALSKDGNPTLSTVAKVAGAFGYRLTLTRI